MRPAVPSQVLPFSLDYDIRFRFVHGDAQGPTLMLTRQNRITVDPILRYISGELPHLNLSGKVLYNPLPSDKGGCADIHRGSLELPEEQGAVIVAVKRLRSQVLDAKAAKLVLVANL